MISDTQRNPSHATTKLMLFTVSKNINKDEWNTKEDTGKPLKNATDYGQKAPLGLK